MLCAQMDQVVIDPASLCGFCVPDNVQSVVSISVQGNKAASTLSLRWKCGSCIYHLMQEILLLQSTDLGHFSQSTQMGFPIVLVVVIVH